VRIGYSKGLGIPKPILEQCGFGAEVEPGRLVVLAAARAGWDQAFAAAGPKQPLLLPDGIGSGFVERAWDW
jgi:hypothetical protein